MVPTNQSDNSQDLAEALDKMAKALSAIDHKLEILIARFGADSSAVAIVAASLEGASNLARRVGASGHQ
jgi:hypothetical protein